MMPIAKRRIPEQGRRGSVPEAAIAADKLKKRKMGDTSIIDTEAMYRQVKDPVMFTILVQGHKNPRKTTGVVPQ